LGSSIQYIKKGREYEKGLFQALELLLYPTTMNNQMMKRQRKRRNGS
jgi:hypothetical protein